MKQAAVFMIIASTLLMNNSVLAAREGSVTTDYLRFDDEKVTLDIYNPKSFNCPVVILIHGAAGIEGDRAVRYRNFATDLMKEGIVAINVHYFDSKRGNWINTIIKTIDYAQAIPNANKNQIGVVGYSLGGTIAIKVASRDERVKVLVVNSGYLPMDFTKDDAKKLPKTFMISGTEDSSINTLYQLRDWFKEFNKPFYEKIDEGYGHTMPIELFNENWKAIVQFLTDNL